MLARTVLAFTACDGGDGSGPYGSTQSADLCHWGSMKMGEVGHASAWTLQVASLPAPQGCEEVGGAGKPTPLPGEGKAAERVGRLVDTSEMAGHSCR